MIQQIRKYIRSIPLVRKIVAYIIVPSGFFDKKVLEIPLGERFTFRVNEVISCPDNKHIVRVADAGNVVKGKQIIHQPSVSVKRIALHLFGRKTCRVGHSQSIEPT